MTTPAIRQPSPLHEWWPQIEPPCECGTNVLPHEPPCNKPADYLILGHACRTTALVNTAYICTHHLNLFRTLTDGPTTYCPHCTLRATTFAQWIYRTTPIR